MPRGPVRLIGLDAAVDPRNNALSCGELRWDDVGVATLHIEELVAPRDEEELHQTLLGWASMEREPNAPSAGESPAPPCAVFCVDSPLGWPAELGKQLASHVAGAELSGDANDLFRRVTDRDIHQRLNKTPLDVGADRIARTAHRTLARLGRVGDSTTRVVPRRRTELTRIGTAAGVVAGVAGERDTTDTPLNGPPISLLETYPAGWFASERIDTRGYRPLPAGERRRALWQRITTVMDATRRPALCIAPQITVERIVRRADELDSILCLIVGAEALLGRAPDALDLFGDELLPRIQLEGWIWCKSPE